MERYHFSTAICPYSVQRQLILKIVILYMLTTYRTAEYRLFLESRMPVPPPPPPPAIDLPNSGAAFDPGLGCSRDPRLLLQGSSSTWIPETDKPYMCSSCGKGYTHIFTLNRHRRTVCGKIRNTSGKWKCPRCARSYVTEGNLVRHIRFECGVRRKFCCIFCNRKFTQRCSLIRHLRNFHNESFASASTAAGPKYPPPMEMQHLDALDTKGSSDSRL